MGAVVKAGSPRLRRYKVMPDSGYFVDHRTTNNESVIAAQFKSIFELSNASATVPPNCVAAHQYVPFFGGSIFAIFALDWVS